MSIYSISLIWLLLAFLLGYKKTALSLPFLISLLLLIPNAIKFNLGVNLNIFNLSVLIFFFLSLGSIQKNTPINNRINTYLKGYFIYVCLYSLMVSFTYFTFGGYLQNMLLFFFEYIGMAYCLNYVRLNEKSIKYFNAAIIVSSIIIIVYGIFNYIVKFNPYLFYISIVADLDVDMANEFMEEQRGFLNGRISSTFSHPLQLGQAALLLFSYILYELRGKINTIVYWGILIGLILMCILCGSRSAIFPLLISVFFYLRCIKISKRFIYALVFIFAISISYSRMSYTMQRTLKSMVLVWDDSVFSRANMQGSSVSGRSAQYVAALKIIKNDLLFGRGKGYVKKYGNKHYDMYGYESFVLKELVDGGFCGVFAFAIFYILVYRAFIKSTITPLERGRFHSLCGSFFISSFLTGVSYSFFSLYMTLCFVSYYSCLNDRNNMSKKLIKI